MDGVDLSGGRRVLGARGVIEDPSPGNVLRRDFTDYRHHGIGQRNRVLHANRWRGVTVNPLIQTAGS